ncbi:MAG: hypothetical protein CMJ78_22555 [Planctomycetaceae bacterium]|nr:hypothetical protein [Planctomycetaceae bacterium]
MVGLEMNDRAPLSLKKKIAFSLVVVCGFLFLAEVAARIIGLGQKKEVADYIANWKRQWDSDFYLMDLSLVGPETGINYDGLRDVPHELERKPGFRRIACIGDSVTAGYGVALFESYPLIMEKALMEQGHKVEVFNIALPGWSTRQESIAYERIARKYKPDQVILGFCLNDVAEMQNNLMMQQPSAITSFLYENSNVVRWIMRPHAHEIQRVEDLFDESEAPEIASGWELCFEEILRLKNITQTDGVDFAVIVFPFRFQVADDAPSPIAQRKLEEFCKQHEITFLDTLPAILPLKESGYFDHDHFSARGATAVSNQLIENKLPIVLHKQE